MGTHYILMFTQFRDTQTWLSDYLRKAGHLVTELYGQDHHEGDRGQRLIAFQSQEQGILLCTETASESLNLQFCTAAINYDIPWNPMTLEQRAGRIDRIGQQRNTVDVVNLFYEDTAEHDAYKAVERRFKSIVDNVGTYPPIIAANIQNIIRDGKDPDTELDKIEARNNFDINRLNTQWENRNRELNPKVTMDDSGETFAGTRTPTSRMDRQKYWRETLGGPGRERQHQTGHHRRGIVPNGRRKTEMVGRTLGIDNATET